MSVTYNRHHDEKVPATHCACAYHIPFDVMVPGIGLTRTTLAPITLFSPRREFYQGLCEAIKEEESRCCYLIHQVDMAWFENIDCLPYKDAEDYYLMYQLTH